MYEKSVLLAEIRSQLPYRLKKRKTLNISHGTTDLDYDDIVVVFKGKHTRFYLIRYVGNYLDRFAEEFPFPFLGNNGIVDFAACKIVFFAELSFGKSFVMTEIEIRFRPVIGNKDLPMLKRVHRARINVYVGIKLLKGDSKTTAFKKETY